MDPTMFLLFGAVGFIVFMVLLLGFMRTVTRVGVIEETSKNILIELRYMRHLEEVKAEELPADE